MVFTTLYSRAEVLINQDDVAKMSCRTALSKRLDTIILKKVEFTNAPLEDVLTFLNHQSSQEDSDHHKGVNFVSATSLQNHILSSERVTLTLENATLLDVLNYVVSQAHLEFDIGFNSVYVRQPSDFPIMVVMSFTMPAGVYRYDGFKSGTDLKHHFIGVGIRFPKGASVEYLPGSKQIVVRNTPEQLALMRELLLQASKFD